MIPSIDSMIIREPIKKQFLTIIMEENDNVYDCIKQAMTDNAVRKCTVTECDGSIKSAVINCFCRNNYQKIEFENKQILKVSGEFKLTGNDLWGQLKIFTEGKNPIQGTLSKGIANENFTLKLSFVR